MTTKANMINGWSEDHTAKFQNDIVSVQHKLNDTGLFTDEALAELLDKHPSHQLDLCAMPKPGSVDKYSLRTGDSRLTDGKTMIAAAKAGTVWINMRRAMNIHPEYKAVLDEIYGDLADLTGSKVYNPNGGILISSPAAKVPFHCDKTETILWHVRGKKRIYIYPKTQKYMSDEAYENVLINPIADDLPYRKEMDEGAKVFDLEPGQMITWPLNSPHRVDNQAYCVSITTEYSTRKSAMKNSAMITNATLRAKFGMDPSWDNMSTPNRYIKSIFGKVLKKAKFAPSIKPVDLVTFKLDPEHPGFVADVDPYVRDF